MTTSRDVIEDAQRLEWLREVVLAKLSHVAEDIYKEMGKKGDFPAEWILRLMCEQAPVVEKNIREQIAWHGDSDQEDARFDAANAVLDDWYREHRDAVARAILEDYKRQGYTKRQLPVGYEPFAML